MDSGSRFRAAVFWSDALQPRCLQVLAQRTEILCMLHPVPAAIAASWGAGAASPPPQPEAARPHLAQHAKPQGPQVRGRSVCGCRRCRAARLGFGFRFWAGRPGGLAVGRLCRGRRGVTCQACSAQILQGRRQLPVLHLSACTASMATWAYRLTLDVKPAAPGHNSLPLPPQRSGAGAHA